MTIAAALPLALAATMFAAAVSASEPEGASTGQVETFTAAAARLGLGWDARTGTCILDHVAIEAGPTAVEELVTLTENAATGRENRRDATLRFVGRHGDAFYGIVAECSQADAIGN